jgi:hypothetical protein
MFNPPYYTRTTAQKAGELPADTPFERLSQARVYSVGLW